MTLHTMRGATGLIKVLYSFHANVVSSYDMAIFLAWSNGALSVAQELKEKKISACVQMRVLLYASILTDVASGVIQWVWLYDAWMHHLNFHIGVMESIVSPDEEHQYKPPNCKWEI